MKTALVVGSGGREHALAWALARSPQIQHVYVAPGNAGTRWDDNPSATGLQPRAASTNVPIAVEDFTALIAYTRQQALDFVVVGPEAPLAAGIVDAFQAAGLRIFGPTRDAARLESSKAFAKGFMREHHIPCAESATFDDYAAALQFLADRETAHGPASPLVVKADGLAAGKGVMVCNTIEEARTALHRTMVDRSFGAAGHRVVIEERLYGRELSILAFTDGQTIVPMPPARDHKPVYDDDQGPNTGGMGAYTHPPDVDGALLEMIERTVLRPAIDGMAARGTPYRGVLYAGLILTPDGPKVLEFNCRFGDPEIEAILPLLEADMAEVLLACIEGRLGQVSIPFRPGVGATVVLASPGYPGPYPGGIPITGLETLATSDDIIVFHAGTTQREGDGHLVTAGGRVLAVSAVGESLPATLRRVYEGVAPIHFEGMHYRRDIGGLL
ncbi:MAG: phosphoribosylamine--glycine ligase [Chloroflexaceae bacterium]|nr:phosphoribosylamine--glycine ligase [Chloroflexaceae bacterium]